MIFFTKQKIKLLFCFLLILGTSFTIYLNTNKKGLTVSKTITNNNEITKLEVKSSLIKDSDVKLYQKTNEEDFKEIEVTKETQNFLKKKNIFELDTQDKEKPDNITNIKSSIVDNYVILDFDKAKDNGTSYSYYLQENKNNEEIVTDVKTIYNESGIKGYNFIIDNEQTTQAGYEVNKNNHEPILISNIEWDKNYYLHIRSIDNNNNYSDTLTYKINLPSKGIRMQYLDMNNYQEISTEETVIGNINDEYNVKDYNKKISGYKLVKTDGEEEGKLKKEKINIKYLYAKNASLVIKYINKLTGEEIAQSTHIDGYEGKNYNIEPKEIKGYKYSSGKEQVKMKAGTQIVNLYYDEIGNVQISFVDEKTGENILPDEVINNLVGTTYETEEKEIPGYELIKIEGNKEGTIASTTTYITYYYKKKAKVSVKHIDIDTNKELEEEILEGYVGDKIIVKSKNFEGYTVYSKSKESDDKSEKNIIDEILADEEYETIENEKSEEKTKDSFQQYDIILDTSQKEYIIYYKKK